MHVEIKEGSATNPQPKNGRGVVIAHICNDIGAYGKGFVLAVNKMSYAPRDAYKALVTERKLSSKPVLGFVSYVNIEDRIWIASMISQHGIAKSSGEKKCLIDYRELENCLVKLFQFAIKMKCDVHMPDGIGSGLAGGDKIKIHNLIESVANLVESWYPKLESVDKNINITFWKYSP